MDTSTPVAQKKQGPGLHQENDVNVSPITSDNIDTKRYSKRERKPRKWAGFETSETETKVKTTPDSKCNSTENDSKNDASRVDVTDSITTDTADVDITESSIDISVTDGVSEGQNVKKKGRQKKVKDNSTDTISPPATVRKNSVKKKRSRSNSVNSVESLKKSNNMKGDTNEWDERLTADHDELTRLKETVESKRKTKYIEQVDRVMTNSKNGCKSAKNKAKASVKETVKDKSVTKDVKNQGETNIDKKTVVNGKLNKIQKELLKKSALDVSSDICNGNNDKYTNDVLGEAETDILLEHSNADVGDITNSSLTQPKECGESQKDETPLTVTKKRPGRPRKPKVEISVDPKSDEGEPETEDKPLPRQRGRPKKIKDYSYIDSELDEVDSEKDTSTNFQTPHRKKGRPKKMKNYSYVDSELDEVDSEKDTSTKFQTPHRKKGRPKKEKNISLVDLDISDDTSRQIKRGRPRKRKLSEDLSDTENDSVNNSVKRKNRNNHDDSLSMKAALTPQEKAALLQCQHCEYKGHSLIDIRKHCAIQHQVWWTMENPAGFTDRLGLSRVIGIRKFLNCPKCEKKLNFLQYYEQHLEWCGRENLLYTCEHCNKAGLRLQWKHFHIKTCPALREEVVVTKEPEVTMQDDTENNGKGSKRKAAKKAMSIVHNLSKSMDTMADLDDSDRDPDAVINHDDEEEDDHEIDAEIDEESDSSHGNTDDEIDDVIDEDKTKTSRFDTSWSSARNLRLNSYEITREYVTENWCDDVYTEWLPWKQNWKILSESECKPYVLEESSSAKFCFKKKNAPSSLKLMESAVFNDSPMMYVGFPVWRLSWCPMPLHCPDVQYLALTGKLKTTDIFLSDKNYPGPGIIQIWNTGIDSNQMKTKSLPRLSYTVAHDYGIPTEMKWCPSGCYKTNADKDDSTSYTRLGLLAVSFTDGTCRIFSLPHWLESETEAPPTFKATPTVTLIHRIGYEQDNVVCTTFDWCLTKGHEKIIAGYSNGCVKVFHLPTKSSLLTFSSSDHGQMLLPFRNVLHHGDVVQSVNWCSTSDHLIITACEKFETHFWDLNNLGNDVYHGDQGYMVLKTSSNICQNGCLIAPDDNYTTQNNKARYLECGSLMFLMKNGIRRDECQSFFTSTQAACIWDIHQSDWFPLIVSCDNRGVILSSTLRDMLRHIADTKGYRFRMDLFRTHVIENSNSKPPNCDKQNSSKSNKCQKCISQSDSSSDVRQSDNQSNDLLQCTCDKTDQSELLTNQNAAYSEIDPERYKQCITEQEQRRQEKLEKCVLHFDEHFKTIKGYRFDTLRDSYSRMSLAPLKTLQFNPNNSQCCWLAFSGDTGLVRLVNVRPLLHRLDLIEIKNEEAARKSRGSAVT